MALGKLSSLFNPHSALLALLGPPTEVLAEGQDLKGKLESAYTLLPTVPLAFSVVLWKITGTGLWSEFREEQVSRIWTFCFGKIIPKSQRYSSRITSISKIQHSEIDSQMKKMMSSCLLRVREYTENKEEKRKYDQTDELIWPLIDSDRL